ncbi:hypothetical protein IMY05_002G0040000 [Salix suchowensis]|nr:hypothetical protein IMY05_002G0040000 [Salix suchowensis]
MQSFLAGKWHVLYLNPATYNILFKSLDIPHNTRNLFLLSIPRCILPLLLVNIQSYGNKNLPFTSFFLAKMLRVYMEVDELRVFTRNSKIFKINKEHFMRYLWG